jgi:hypothetical protein
MKDRHERATPKSGWLQRLVRRLRGSNDSLDRCTTISLLRIGKKLTLVIEDGAGCWVRRVIDRDELTRVEAFIWRCQYWRSQASSCERLLLLSEQRKDSLLR